MLISLVKWRSDKLSLQDRTNLGNARVAGLQKDLNMTNTQYSISLTVTYVPYIVAELPSNLMLKVRVEAFCVVTHWRWTPGRLSARIWCCHRCWHFGVSWLPYKARMVVICYMIEAHFLPNTRCRQKLSRFVGRSFLPRIAWRLVLIRFFYLTPFLLALGGVFPGLVLYLSFFYPRQKLQWRCVA